jgi:hypothetical protein
MVDGVVQCLRGHRFKINYKRIMVEGGMDRICRGCGEVAKIGEMCYICN